MYSELLYTGKCRGLTAASKLESCETVQLLNSEAAKYFYYITTGKSNQIYLHFSCAYSTLHIIVLTL